MACAKPLQSLLIERREAVGALFDETTWEERKLSAKERHGTAVVLALRQWIYEGFNELER
ncbi:MAG: hypothetical protein AAFZ58_13395 [Pseudomonadota bacterium]